MLDADEKPVGGDLREQDKVVAWRDVRKRVRAENDVCRGRRSRVNEHHRTRRVRRADMDVDEKVTALAARRGWQGKRDRACHRCRKRQNVHRAVLERHRRRVVRSVRRGEGNGRRDERVAERDLIRR